MDFFSSLAFFLLGQRAPLQRKKRGASRPLFEGDAGRSSRGKKLRTIEEDVLHRVQIFIENFD